MSQPTFSDVFDAAEQLEPEAQAELVDVLSRRLSERGREQIAASVAEARREFSLGYCRVASPEDIVREALR